MTPPAWPGSQAAGRGSEDAEEERFRELLARAQAIPIPSAASTRQFKNTHERDLYRYRDRSTPDVWLDQWDAMRLVRVKSPRTLQRWRAKYRIKSGIRTGVKNEPERVYSRRGLARGYFAARDAEAATRKTTAGPGRPTTEQMIVAREAIAEALAVSPNARTAELAERTGYSPAIVQRHRKALGMPYKRPRKETKK